MITDMAGYSISWFKGFEGDAPVIVQGYYGILVRRLV